MHGVYGLLGRLPHRRNPGITIRARPLFSRVRFQLLAGFLICVLFPALFWFGSLPEIFLNEAGANAVIGAGFAHVVGYYFSRQLGNFPGVQAGAHTVVVSFIPFAVMAAALLVLRLEYSRFIFLFSLFSSVCWITGMQIFLRSGDWYTVSVVPGGQADMLPFLPGVNWKVLAEPPATLNSINAIAVDLRHDLGGEWHAFLAKCSLAGKPVYHSKQLTESLTGKVQIEHMSENSFGSLLPNLAYLKIKHALDLLMAIVALPFFILVTLMVAPLILATCGWPIFYVQERIGYRGKRYWVYKFRTMFPLDEPSRSKKAPEEKQDRSIEELRQAAMTRHGDRRITPIGRFLRKYRIDEMPQILNILKGEMSWIGPRPEAITLAKWYESELDFYPYRHVVKSGISGWAQVNQGHVTGTSQVHEKLHYDFFYIKYLSPWLDLLIVLKTVRTVLFGIGAK